MSDSNDVVSVEERGEIVRPLPVRFPLVEPDTVEGEESKSPVALLREQLEGVDDLSVLVKDLLNIIVSYLRWRSDALEAGMCVDAIDSNEKVYGALILDVKDRPYDVTSKIMRENVSANEATNNGSLNGVSILVPDSKVTEGGGLNQTVMRRFGTPDDPIRERAYLLRYIGWGERWDEWISATAGRITAIRMLTWNECCRGTEMNVRVFGSSCCTTESVVIVSVPGSHRISVQSVRDQWRHQLGQETFATTPHSELSYPWQKSCSVPNCTVQFAGDVSWKRQWAPDAGGWQLQQPSP
jgi:hypothetical protein